jgi:hypothetical protein
MAHRWGGCTWYAPEPARSAHQAGLALVQHPGPGVVFLAPMENDVLPERFAVLAMTLNPRIRIVAGSLVLVRVSTQEPGQ